MKITHDASEHAFYAYDDNDRLMGEIHYSPRGDGAIAATHTVTDERFQGHGVAGKLLDVLVQYAVDNQATITPYCSYVVAAFRKNPEKYKAVIDPDAE